MQRATVHGSDIIKCPICRREYCEYDVDVEDLDPILFKVVFNDMSMGQSHFSNLFFYTSKYNLRMYFPEAYLIDKIWVKKIKILLNILYTRFKSESYFNPLVLYLYKDEVNSFTLKSNKPSEDNELVDINDFYGLKQDDEIIDGFLESKFGKSLFKVNN